MAELTLQMDGTATVLTVTTAEGVVEGTRVTGKGRILDPAGMGQLDLDLTVSSPLTALLGRAGVATVDDGLLKAEGTVRGPWARPVFQGKASLQPSKASPPRDPLVFDLRWADGRLEAGTPGSPKAGTLWAGLFLTSATGEHRVRLEARDVDLKPFQTVDRAVTSVPLVGWLLSGKNGAVIAAFYRVSGPLSDPVVTSLPARSIGRNVFGVFRRLLQLPAKVTGP